MISKHYVKLKTLGPTFFKLPFFFMAPCVIAGFKLLFTLCFSFVQKQYKVFEDQFDSNVYINCMLTSTSRRDRDENALFGGMAG